MKKHILYILSNLDPANCGIADYFHHLVKFFNNEFRISVITASGKEQFAPAGAEIAGVFSKWDFSELSGIADAVKKANPDIIHLQYTTSLYNSHLMINILPWYLAQKGIKIPFITTFHDLRGPFLMPKLGPFKIRLIPTMMLFNSSDAAVITNNFDYARLKKFLFVKRSDVREKVHCIPVGSNVEPQNTPLERETELMKQYGITQNTLVMVFFGFIIFGKGIESLAELAAEFKKSRIQAKLLLVGRKPEYSDSLYTIIDEKIRKYGLADSVIFTDYVENVSDYINLAHAVTLPFEEGLTLRRTSFITAAAHGAAVVSTESDALPDCIKHNENVVLVPYNNVEKLKEAVLKIYREPGFAERIKLNAAKLSEKFSFRKIAGMHKKMYEKNLL